MMKSVSLDLFIPSCAKSAKKEEELFIKKREMDREGVLHLPSLIEKAASKSGLSDTYRNFAEMLCKRVDVYKSVYDVYHIDGMPAESAVKIDGKMEIYLCALFLYLSRTEENIKFLNSALKMMDGILGTGTEYPECLVSCANRLLENICRK